MYSQSQHDETREIRRQSTCHVKQRQERKRDNVDHFSPMRFRGWGKKDGTKNVAAGGRIWKREEANQCRKKQRKKGQTKACADCERRLLSALRLIRVE